MRIVETPEFEPGCCMVSRASEGPFIDTGLDVDDLNATGRIYLAVSTITGYASELGWIDPQVARTQERRLIDAMAETATLREAVAGLQAANEALVAAGYKAADAPLEVPDGTEQDVLLWVSDPGDNIDALVARAEAARDAEKVRPEPREALIAELEQYLSLKETV